MPVIATEYVPGAVDARVHDAVTVAFATMLVAVAGHIALRPAGVTTDDRLIVPAKLNVLVKVTVIDEPDAPLLKLTGPLRDNEKPPTCETKLTV